MRGVRGAGSAPVNDRGVSSTFTWAGQTVAKGGTCVCLEDIDTEVEDSVGVPPKDPVKEKEVLLKPYDREGEEEEPNRDLRGGKRSRFPSLSESSESVTQQPREEQPVKINSTIGNDLQGQVWQNDTGAQKALADDIEALEAATEAAEQKAK